MLDASLERPKIFFAHYHAHVAGIVIDQCGAAARDRRRGTRRSRLPSVAIAQPPARASALRPSLAAIHARASLLRTAN